MEIKKLILKASYRDSKNRNKKRLQRSVLKDSQP